MGGLGHWALAILRTVTDCMLISMTVLLKRSSRAAVRHLLASMSGMPHIAAVSQKLCDERQKLPEVRHHVYGGCTWQSLQE